MCSGGYYSPRIRKDLIPILYRHAKEKAITMTRLVDSILRPELTALNEKTKLREEEE